MDDSAASRHNIRRNPVAINGRRKASQPGKALAVPNTPAEASER